MAPKKKLRISPFSCKEVRDALDNRTESEQIDGEIEERFDTIEFDALTRDREYQKAFVEVVERTSKKGKSPYTPHDKLRAALAYIISASSKKAETMTGIPAHTIRTWKTTAPWWPKAVEYALLAKREELDANLTEIQTLANTAVMDRIRNGDEKYVNGESVRILMSGKDLMLVSSIARDKQAVMRGQPTSITAKLSDDDKLTALADKITRAITSADPKVIEGVILEEGET